MKASAPLTAADLFQVGHWFLRGDPQLEFLPRDTQKPLEVEARADDNTIQRFTLTELFAPTPPTRFAATQTELMTVPDTSGNPPTKVVDAATLPDHLLKRADHIIWIVESVQTHIEQIRRSCQLASEPFSVTEATRQACQASPAPISFSHYYVYRQLYQTHGGDRALIATALHRNTLGKTRIDPNAQHFIDTVIRRFYRSNPPIRAQTVYTIAQHLWLHNRHWWLNFQHR